MDRSSAACWCCGEPAPIRGEDEDRYYPEKCTCTIACIPQGITSEQTCKLQVENER